VARAEAFDAEEHNKGLQELEENRKKTIDQHLKVSRNLLAALNNRTREYLDGTERIPNSVFPSLLSTVTTLQRLTVGEATSRTEDSGKHVRQPDYSQLTDEEVAFLDDIGEKLYGGG
jgi:succinate dehydrogenase/fumarate reductase flavoprotein subunit